MMAKGNKDDFKRQFSRWTKCIADNKVKNIPELMAKVHAAIRAKPARVAKKKSSSKSKIVQQKPKMIFECANKKKYLREKKVPPPRRTPLSSPSSARSTASSAASDSLSAETPWLLHARRCEVDQLPEFTFKLCS